MNFALDDEQQLIVSTVRRLATRQLATWAADADRAAAPPDALADVAAEVGFLVDAVPADRGGLLEGDFSHVTRVLRGIELARACPALAALLECNVEPALAVGRWGSRAAADALFAALGDGGLATTARDAGARLDARRDGDELVVSGSLPPIACLAGATHLLLVTDDAVALVATADAAITPVTPSGWRAARWATVSFDQLRVGADFVLGGADVAAEIMAWYRLSLAARAVGTSLVAMEHAAGYAAERVQFGQPIGRFESLIGLRDQNETAAMAARALTLEAAWKLDTGAADAADAASRARDFAAQVVARATIDAVQIYGGYGFVNDYPVEKLMRDARAFEVVGGNESFDRVLALKEAI